MAIKKDIIEGTIIAKRNIVGYAHSRQGTSMNFSPFVGFITNIPDDEGQYMVTQTENKHTHVLYLENRRSRTKGTIVTDEMVPLLTKLNVRLIPIKRNHYLGQYRNGYGFFSPSYTEYLTTQTHMRLVADDRQIRRRHSEYTVINKMLTAPRYTRQITRPIYMAVGLSIRHYTGENNEFPDVHVDPVIHKYEADLKNDAYSSLLSKRGHSILEV